ncbi:hypothetical protein BHM03_00018290 [Ensete ventricosum]|nr:hypothetical protein BHM03_00018290 [Ensete ventricosum]
MGLITHNRIKLCISTSPCPVIVNLVIIGSVGSSHHHVSRSPATASWVPLGRPCRRQPLWVVPLPAGCLPAGAEPAVGSPLHGRPSADRWQQPLWRGRGRLSPLAGVALQPATLGRLPPAVWLRVGTAPLRAGPGRSRSPLCRRPGRSRPPLCRGALAAASRPYKGADRGHARLPLLRASFVAKTQQERVERFYVTQSHHTQFKTNLSHENLGSDTIDGKPTAGRSYVPIFQIRMEKMKEVMQVRGIANSKDSVLMQRLIHGRQSVRGHPKENKIGVSPTIRWQRPCMRVAVYLSNDQEKLLGGHSGVEAGGRKGRGSDDESSGAQLPKRKASVRKEVDSEEHHSAAEVDLPITKEETQM